MIQPENILWCKLVFVGGVYKGCMNVDACIKAKRSRMYRVHPICARSFVLSEPVCTEIGWEGFWAMFAPYFVANWEVGRVGGIGAHPTMVAESAARMGQFGGLRALEDALGVVDVEGGVLAMKLGRVETEQLFTCLRGKVRGEGQVGWDKWKASQGVGGRAVWRTANAAWKAHGVTRKGKGWEGWVGRRTSCQAQAPWHPNTLVHEQGGVLFPSSHAHTHIHIGTAHPGSNTKW
ncbi:hypothetical protein BDN71DRAFT_1431670 [Pleurotus eryngii]|uniref:Uncharacterized protein n=1 Tax=Pleurotus eryngii TaxID=5323 RepID=A0A9P5ZWT1_PLEER|nr:hypothetical protein BDN71DRAFT_1431670 [Pleurotus eryngii]